MTDRDRRQRIALVVVGWLGAAALATAVTLAAVSFIGAGIFGTSSGSLDQEEIARALATSPATSEPPEPAGSPSPEPTVTETTPEPTVITSTGGTVVARCSSDGLAEVVSWSPAQGYRVDNADRGPAREVEVEFESGDHDVEVKLRCADGVVTRVGHDDD